MQGSGSAILKWFNLQSITEVKSQLETMHLLFGAPRFLCSREFKDLWLHSEIRMAKSTEQIRATAVSAQPITCRSGAEVYVHRDDWELPSLKALKETHPLTRCAWWREILRTVQQPISDRQSLEERYYDVKEMWPKYLRLMSWWQLKRFFKRAGKTIFCKDRADVVVVHPAGRFTSAKTDEQWRDASLWTLLAYCNHGNACEATFRDIEHLKSLPLEALDDLTRKFVLASAEERLEQEMTKCPPHVFKNWHLGCARRERAEQQKMSVSKISEAIRKHPRFVFAEEETSWRQCYTTDMTVEDLASAKLAWKEAEDAEEARVEVAEDDGTDADKLCPPKETAAIRKRMHGFMRVRLKWTHRELHDAVLTAGLQIPTLPSLLTYFGALHSQYGDTQLGFLPQAFGSHKKQKIQDLLKCLSRTGAKLGGKLADKKNLLLERLAYWLQQVLEAGREVVVVVVIVVFVAPVDNDVVLVGVGCL
jgi:hypothetical protein